MIESIVQGLQVRFIRFISLGILVLLLAVKPALAQNWSASTSSFMPWTAVASSANGRQVWAALTNGPVFHSTNSGASWGTVHWENPYYTTGLASSPNGNVLAACTGFLSPGRIYVSTDSGVTWPQSSAPLKYWTSITCSAAGHKLMATATNGDVYISEDTGETWLPSGSPAQIWVSSAMSADGSQLALVSTNGILCISSDGGNTWTTNNPGNSSQPLAKGGEPALKNANGAPNTNWQAVACSADKSRLVAVVNGGPIYLSTDAGTNWTASTAPSAGWKLVACSANGSAMIAATTNGPIYTSIDFGTSWVSNTVAVSRWVSVAVSADGSRMVAAAAPGFGQPQSRIYTLYNEPKPRLNLVETSNQVSLAWTIPGTNFVVQQSANLDSSGWLTLTNAPTLNLSNLQYELSLSSSNSSGFFRLSTP